MTLFAVECISRLTNLSVNLFSHAHIDSLSQKQHIATRFPTVCHTAIYWPLLQFINHNNPHFCVKICLTVSLTNWMWLKTVVNVGYIWRVYNDLLTIDPTSVECKRTFSFAGYFCNKIRSKLSDKTLNSLSFRRRNLQNNDA